MSGVREKPVSSERRKQMRFYPSLIRIGYIGAENPEYDELHPKVLWRGKLYRFHKRLDKGQVRLVTTDHGTCVDVPINEITWK
jgi:hypothetical protein